MSLAPVRPVLSVTAPVASTSTTLGALLDDVDAALASAGVLGRAARIDGRRPAVCAALAHADVLGGLGTLWAALWRERTEVADDVRRLGGLLPASSPARLDGGEHSACSRALSDAATAARSAADLIATHRGPAGGWRSPESEVLDDEELLHGAAGRVAGLAFLTTTLRGAIVRALLDARVGSRAIAGLVGDENELQLCASRFARSAPSMSPAIAGLGVARPVVRSDDEPGRQALDRWRRLRTAAWELSTAPTASATTLTDLATAACVLNRAAASSHVPGSAPEAWRALRPQLADLRTTALRSATVRTDIVVLGMLLQELAPPVRREVAAAAVAGLPRLARWCAAAFANARANDIVYVDATRLHGSEVTDHPELVVAKLRGRLVPAPAPRLSAVRALYAAAAGEYMHNAW